MAHYKDSKRNLALKFFKLLEQELTQYNQNEKKNCRFYFLFQNFPTKMTEWICLKPRKLCFCLISFVKSFDNEITKIFSYFELFSET